MSKEYIIKNIELIDEELKKNEEFINAHNIEYVTTLHVTTKLLIEARKMWVDMLWLDYGICY